MSGWTVRFSGFKANKPTRGTFHPDWTKLPEIEKAVESSPPLRAEIRRTFQVANRRIQNIENAGLASPAVVAANKGDVHGYTKFSMRNSWNNLKEEYARALAFLSDRTSTASGARQYKKALQHAAGMDNDPVIFDKVYDKAVEKTNEIVSNSYINYRYESAVNLVKTNIESAASSIMHESEAYERQIQQDVKNSARDFFKRLENGQVIM